MTDQNAIRDDIAFMRALAEEGRNGPLVGGPMLLASGLCFGSASLAVWLNQTFALVTSSWSFFAIWTISLALFLAVLFVARPNRRPSAGASRAIGVAWSGGGLSIFFVGLSLVVMVVRGKDPYVANVFLPFILSIYGSAWFVAAVLSKTRWLSAVAAGSFLFALVTAWFASDGLIVFLIYGLGLYALVAAPGYVLMRKARPAAA
jgi:hypothetical protein